MIFLTYFYNHCIVIHVHFLFRYLTKSYWSLNYLSWNYWNWNYLNWNWNYWNVKRSVSVIVSVNQILNVIWKNYCDFLMMNVLTNHLTFNGDLLNLCLLLYLYIHQTLYHHTIQGFLKHCSRY